MAFLSWLHSALDSYASRVLAHHEEDGDFPSKRTTGLLCINSESARDVSFPTMKRGR